MLKIIIIGIKIAVWQECLEASDYSDTEVEQCDVDHPITDAEWNLWWSWRDAK